MLGRHDVDELILKLELAVGAYNYGIAAPELARLDDIVDALADVGVVVEVSLR